MRQIGKVVGVSESRISQMISSMLLQLRSRIGREGGQ